MARSRVEHQVKILFVPEFSDTNCQGINPNGTRGIVHRVDAVMLARSCRDEPNYRMICVLLLGTEEMEKGGQT